MFRLQQYFARSQRGELGSVNAVRMQLSKNNNSNNNKNKEEEEEEEGKSSLLELRLALRVTCAQLRENFRDNSLVQTLHFHVLKVILFDTRCASSQLVLVDFSAETRPEAAPKPAFNAVVRVGERLRSQLKGQLTNSKPQPTHYQVTLSLAPSFASS